MIQGAGYKAGSLAPMACYLDNVEAWSVNECTINWNSPLVWIASFLEDEAPNVNKDTDVTTTTTTNSGSTTTTTTDDTTLPQTGYSKWYHVVVILAACMTGTGAVMVIGSGALKRKQK